MPANMENSAVATGRKGPFLFQSQRRAMPNDVQTTAQLCSSHMLEKPREFQKNICFIDHAQAFDCASHNKLWKILQQMGIPDHFMCLLRNLDAGQEPTVRTRYGTTDWFKIGKWVCQACVLSFCLFNIYAEYIMQNARLEEAQAGIEIEIAIISDMQMRPPLWQKEKRN